MACSSVDEHQCLACGQSFASVSNLNRHKDFNCLPQRSSKEPCQSFVCGNCDLSYVHRQSFNRHKARSIGSPHFTRDAMENTIDRKERTVYVTGMSARMSEDVLYDLFQRAGAIEKVILKENTDGSPQHALVIFKNVESVMIAISSYNGHTLFDQPMGLRPLRESSHHAVLEQAISDQMRAGIPQHRYPTRAAVRYQQEMEQQQAAASAAALAEATQQHKKYPRPPQPHGPLGASLFGGPSFAWPNQPGAGYYGGMTSPFGYGTNSAGHSGWGYGGRNSFK